MPDTTPLGDRLVSWLRTAIPGLWALAVGWLAGLGLPDTITHAVDGLGQMALVPLALGIIYPLLRALEAHLPPWLTRILLGSNSTPSYAPTGPDSVPDISSIPPNRGGL